MGDWSSGVLAYYFRGLGSIGRNGSKGPDGMNSGQWSFDYEVLVALRQ